MSVFKFLAHMPIKKEQEFFTMRFPLIVFITLSLLLSSAGADDYNYPYHDPYLATATTAILNDDDPSSPVKSQVVHVPGLPNRNQLPSLEGRGQVSVSLYRQNRSAPLLFILSMDSDISLGIPALVEPSLLSKVRLMISVVE